MFLITEAFLGKLRHSYTGNINCDYDFNSKMDSEEEARRAAEADFIDALFAYVLPRRIRNFLPVRHSIMDRPVEDRQSTVDQTSEEHRSTVVQPGDVHFTSDIGEAILFFCHLNAHLYYYSFTTENHIFLANMPAFMRYCSRFGLDLLDINNPQRSLLMFTGMMIEMVSYCLMPEIPNGQSFANYARTCWLSIFVNRFAETFYMADDWNFLRQQGCYIARQYREVQRREMYLPHMIEGIPYHCWINTRALPVSEQYIQEANYWRARDWTHEIMEHEFRNEFCSQDSTDSSESELETNKIQPNISQPSSNHGLSTGTIDTTYTLKFPMIKEKDLSNESGSHGCVDLNMEKLDSDTACKAPLHTKSIEFDEFPKTILRTKENSQTLGFEVCFDENDFLDKFLVIVMNKVEDGIYLNELFGSKDTAELLMNDCQYVRLMEKVVKNPHQKPDTKKLIVKAKRIIRKSCVTELETQLLEKQSEIIPSVIRETEKNTYMNTLKKATEKDNLLTSSEHNMYSTNEVEEHRGLFLERRDRTNMQEKLSPVKVDIINFEKQVVFTVDRVKNSIEEALRLLKEKKKALDECKNFFRKVVKKKYIIKVTKHVNFVLDTQLPETSIIDLDDLNFNYSLQEIAIMNELNHFRHTLIVRIQTLLQELPVCLFRRYVEKELQNLVSGAVSTRNVIESISRSYLPITSEIDNPHLSQIYTEHIRQFIGINAYCLRLEDKLKEKIKEIASRGSISTMPAAITENILPKSNACTRKRQKSQNVDLVESSSTENILPNANAYTKKRRKSESIDLVSSSTEHAKVESTNSQELTIEDSVNCLGNIPKRPRLLPD